MLGRIHLVSLIAVCGCKIAFSDIWKLDFLKYIAVIFFFMLLMGYHGLFVIWRPNLMQTCSELLKVNVCASRR